MHVSPADCCHHGNHYWSTSANDDSSDIDIIIAYLGKMQFHDTREKKGSHSPQSVPATPKEEPRSGAKPWNTANSKKAGILEEDLDKNNKPKGKVPDKSPAPDPQKAKPIPDKEDPPKKGKENKYKLKINKHRLKWRKAKKCIFQCPSKRCETETDSNKDLTSHVKAAHPSLSLLAVTAGKHMIHLTGSTSMRDHMLPKFMSVNIVEKHFNFHACCCTIIVCILART